MADLDACNDVADTLFAQKERYKDLSREMASALTLSDSINANQTKQIEEKTLTETAYKKESKKQSIVVKMWKGIATGFGVVALVEFVYISFQRLIVAVP